MDPNAAPQQVVNACPACGTLSDVTAHEPFTKVTCPSCDTHFRARTTFNHFEIIEQIGVGGMSRVFRAEDRSLGRHVALKILNKACSEDRKRAQQFEKEAEITAQISHPNVVRVYTAGRDQGHFYIAMELVSGGSLENYIRDRRKMKEAAALEMTIHAVQGLKAAHEAGLIHRDIKPGNILFAEDGTPKIVDFGLAIFARDADGSGEIWATPFYVPLETLNHAPEDFRSDIYSLGATLYHLLTGKPPCSRDTSSLQELKELKSKPIHVKPSTHKISDETCAVLERALSVKPEGRYSSYDEFLDHLKYAQRRLRRGGKGKPWPGRRRRGFTPWQWAAAAAAVIIAGTGFYMVTRKQPQSRITGSSTLITYEDPTIGSDSSTSKKFHDARDAMVAGDFGKGRQFFEEVAAAAATGQPARIWARFNGGLCALFMGDNAGAQRTYAGIAADGLFSSSASDAELAHFFLNSSSWLAPDGPVSAARKADCAADSVQVVGLLAAGLKNWNTGDAAGALDFLTAFEASKPPVKADWVNACKRLVAAHLADAKLAAGLPSPEFSKSTAEEVDSALSSARKNLAAMALPGPVRDKAAAAVSAMEASAARRKEELITASGGSRDQRANAELKSIRETNTASASLGETFRFMDAAAKLDALRMTTPESTASREAHRNTWAKASAFMEQISQDLAKYPVEEIIESGGSHVRATISISGAVLTAKHAQGNETRIPVSRTPPALLAALASDFLTRTTDSDDFYRRGELLYCFALRTGLANTAKAWADTLSSELKEFRRQLSILQTNEVVSSSGVGPAEK